MAQAKSHKDNIKSLFMFQRRGVPLATQWNIGPDNITLKFQTLVEEENISQLPEVVPQKPAKVAPKGVRKTPKTSAVSSHVTLSESTSEADLASEAEQKADISQTTQTIAKAMVLFKLLIGYHILSASLSL